MDYNAPLFQHPPQIWDVKKCERLCKKRQKDGCGTPYPFLGFLPRSELGCHYAHGMLVRYNGGTVIDGKWWQGEEWKLPIVPDGFEIIRRRTWGYQIVKSVKAAVAVARDSAEDWI